MMERLIVDVQKALNADCYFAALALALTFPDICGKAEYPSEKTTVRYGRWYDEYVGQYEEAPIGEEDVEMPYLSGEVVYSLRNSLLHQGTPNINSGRIKSQANNISHFALKLEPRNRFDIYCDRGCHISSNFSDAVTCTYEVNVRRLCIILYRCARGYYRENKDKFNFFDCHIVEEKSDMSTHLPL